MKNLKFLLRLTSSAVLTTGAIGTVAACNNPATTPDISTGVNVGSVRLIARPGDTYQQLNQNQYLNQLLVDAINSAKGTSITTDDITITNNQVTTDNQTAGTTVVFTVTSNSDQVVGSFNFSTTLSIPNISWGISIPDPLTPVSTGSTYGALNTNPQLLQAVANAINSTLDVNVVAGTDFVLSNDQDYNQNQVPGKTINITVTAMGSQITGSMTFTDTIGKATLNGMTFADPQTAAMPSQTYAQLNNNGALKQLIIQAINTSLGVNANVNDIVLSTTLTGNQVAGTAVPITVTAANSSSALQGSFTFTDTLGTADISGVYLPQSTIGVDSTKTYGALNTNTALINNIVTAINTQNNTTITPQDIVVTNDQTATANQAPNKLVKFTVTASGTATQIKNSFTFVAQLGKTGLNNVTITDPKTAADSNATYGALNNNSIVMNLIASAITTQTGVTVNPADLTVTNNQTATANQAVGQAVVFTVTAIKGTLTGSFTFTDTLATPTINNVTLPAIPLTANIGATYGALNSSTLVTNAINTAIKNATGQTVVAGTDYTVTNNQTATANQTTGQAVTFTVTGIGSKVNGTFTFTTTLGKSDITAVSVTDPKTPYFTVTAGTASTVNDLLGLTALQTAINTAINTTTGQTVVAGTDYTISANYPNTDALGAYPITITVTALPASTKIQGSFSFVDTIQKVSIAAVSLVTFQYGVVFSNARYYSELNAVLPILQNVVAAIQTSLGVTVSTTPGVDFVLSNNQTPTAFMTAGQTVIMTVTAVPTSTKITGSFTFSVNLT